MFDRLKYPQQIPRPQSARDLGSRALPRNVDVTEGSVRRSFDQRVGRPAPGIDIETAIRSAVLVPCTPLGNGDTGLVLTRRAWTLRSHAGEISFPGGVWESGDTTLYDTATRETWEEIGLAPDFSEFIGELDHGRTHANHRLIVPYVVWVKELPELQINDAEVDDVLIVPFSTLLDPDRFHEESWDFGEGWRSIYFFELERDLLWGATAAMLVSFLRTVSSHGKTAFGR